MYQVSGSNTNGKFTFKTSPSTIDSGGENAKLNRTERHGLVQGVKKSRFLAAKGPKRLFQKNEHWKFLILFILLLRAKNRKLKSSDSQKFAKKPIYGPFQGVKIPFLAQNGPNRFFRKKWILPHFNIYYSLTPCQKSENFNDWIIS